MLKKLLLALLTIVVLAIAGVLGWLFIAPPELLRVADGYAAKIVCSNVFLNDRDADAVLADDVQAPGNPVLKFIKVKVDRTDNSVTAGFFGLVAPQRSAYVTGWGCTALPDGKALPARPVLSPVPAQPWPATIDPQMQAIVSRADLTGPGMRAVIVIRDGTIVAETYGKGFDRHSRLLGWSLTKSVNAAILGRVTQTGRLALDDTALFPQWTDQRRAISVHQLLSMTSGLTFNEDSGDVSDASRMLFEQPDQAAFAADKPLFNAPGSHFFYSTGTAVLLSRIWMDRTDDAQTFPRRALFAPLGMASAVFETDEHGTFAGGSSLYASARDWARFGQLLMQDGAWNGQQLIPADFVKLMWTSNGFPHGYSQAQTWLKGPEESDSGKMMIAERALWLRGHDGQSITILTDQKLIVLRMGLTPWKMGYRPEALVKTLIRAEQDRTRSK